MTTTTITTTSPPVRRNNPNHVVDDVMAADASFLETVDTPVLELHRSNVLRIETQELIDECTLPLVLPSGAGAGSTMTTMTTKEVKWAKTARTYVDTVHQLVQTMKPCTLSQDTYPFPLLVHHKTNTNTNTTKHTNHLTFEGGSSLRIQSTGAAAAAASTTTTTTSTGWLTHPLGNAQEIPVLDYVIQFPNPTSSTKAYRNYDYFHQRNRFAYHIATHLSAAKYKHLVGSVHLTWTHEHRKLNILLTPPTLGSSSDPPKKKKTKHPKTTTTPTTTTMMKKVRFRVQLVFGYQSMDWIPSSRFFPHRSNISSSHSSSSSHNSSSGEENATTTLTAAAPTPTYNYDLTQDGIIETHVLQHHNDNDNGVEGIPGVVGPTVILLKIWCLQHGFLRGHDTFTTTHLMLLVWYLLQTRKVTPRMSPLQAFTVVLKFLHDTPLVVLPVQESSPSPTTTPKTKTKTRHPQPPRTALIMPLPHQTEAQTIQQSTQAQLYAKCHEEEQSTPPTLIECFLHSCEGPVFLDSTLRHNYWGRLTSNFIQVVQQTTGRTLDHMRNPHISHPFRTIFMETNRFWNTHDVYIRIPLKDIQIDQDYSTTITTTTNQHRWFPRHSRHHHHMDYKTDMGTFSYIQQGLLSMMQQALGNRIKSMRILTTGNGRIGSTNNSSTTTGSNEIPSYPVRGKRSHLDDGTPSPTTTRMTTDLQSPTGDTDIILGFVLDPDHASRIVDRGPPANDTQGVEDFVQLWGSTKAQLRRFKDGAIVHAVVWEDRTSGSNSTSSSSSDMVSLANDDTTQGSIVECIVRHILQLHFWKHPQSPHRRSSSDTTIAKKSKKNSSSKNPTSTPNVQFALRNMLSLVEGVTSTTSPHDTQQRFWTDSTFAHRQVMNAFESLSDFLRQHSRQTIPVEGTGIVDAKRSRLGIPLTIDGVEPLSASLRYAEVFPPLPHASLGGSATLLSGGGKKNKPKVTGAILSSPIHIQIRFGSSSKWPTDLRAMGAAKTAMLLQLAQGIEDMQGDKYGFACRVSTSSSSSSSSIHVTPQYMDIGYKGYAWRIFVRADPELKMLRDLRKPSPEALDLLRTLTRDHVIAAMHHSTIHKVHTEHPSSSCVVRLAKRWVASHMLSDLIPSEAIELLVAKVYNDWDTPSETPSSVSNGFIRFLKLVSTHDWARQPLIVDPQGHISEDDRTQIMARFEFIRGPNQDKGPAMYIISPNDRQGDIEMDETPAPTGTTPAANTSKAPTLQHVWVPSFTMDNPEWVILSRAKALAKRSHDYLMDLLIQGDTHASTTPQNSRWSAIFQETTTSLKSFSALMRVDPDFVVDHECSSTTGSTGRYVQNHDANRLESSYTQSLRNQYMGPKLLRRKVYRNLDNDDANGSLMNWTPIQQMVHALRQNFGSLALFFYNEMSPDVIAMLWRPTAFTPQPLSVLHSEYKRPSSAKDQEWSKDTLVCNNAQDILRELSRWTKDIILDTKVLDARPITSMSRRQQQQQHAQFVGKDGGESSSNPNKRKMMNDSDSDDASSNSDSDDDDSSTS